MGQQYRHGGFIGTESQYWVVNPSPVYDGVWSPNEVLEFNKILDSEGYTPAWSPPGQVPVQAPIQAHLFHPGNSSPTGSITIPTTTPHIFVFASGGGGGGGVDFDDGQARSGGTAGSGYALIQRSSVASNNQTTLNYSVGGGGGGAGARSNDGGGGSGGNSSVTFGSFSISANGGGGGCGKCASNGSNGNVTINGTSVFSGPGGKANTWVTGTNAPAGFVPVENIPVTTQSRSFGGAGGGNNGGGAGGSGQPGGVYVRFGRGINSSTTTGPGNDYGVPTPSYSVPSVAKSLDL